MQEGKRHLFHVLEPSFYPVQLALGLFFFVTGLGFLMHHVENAIVIFLLGIIIIIFIASSWFMEIFREATVEGFHTLVVKKGLKSGFLLFIASEIMLFFGFFWAFFHSALSPSIELGSVWPPYGLNIIPVFDFPLFNTFILIISGFSVTWVHRGVAIGSFKEAIDGFLITIILGIFFIYLQGNEYYEATFNLEDGIYPSVFYMLTGLHGCHVIVGVVFLIVCFVSLLFNHYLTTHYLRLVFAIWYWHFVDIVWILLFLSLYCWSSW
jgi:cytochrome c oxidase subunit 3